jgi:hypothetical protein
MSSMLISLSYEGKRLNFDRMRNYLLADTHTHAHKNCTHKHGAHQGCQMVYFRTKKKIWVNFGGPWNGKGWHILHMAIWNVHFTAI